MAILTVNQLTYIYGLLASDYAKYAQDPTGLGEFSDAYAAVAADLTTYIPSGEQTVPLPNDGVSAAVWLWISGAAGVLSLGNFCLTD
jgi:hypothetical protein